MYDVFNSLSAASATWSTTDGDELAGRAPSTVYRTGYRLRLRRVLDTMLACACRVPVAWQRPVRHRMRLPVDSVVVPDAR